MREDHTDTSATKPKSDVDSEEFKRKLRAANDILKKSDFGNALNCFKELARQWPRSDRAWMGAGRAACALGQMAEADQAWQHVRELHPHNPVILLELARLYHGLQHTEKARALFWESAAAAPDWISPKIFLAALEEKQNRVEEARRHVDQSFAIDPANEDARYLSALLYQRENKLAEAERLYRELIASPPKLEHVRYGASYELAQILDRTGRFDEAIQCLCETKALAGARPDLKDFQQKYEARAEQSRRDARAHPKNILRAWAKTFPEKERSQIPRLAFLGGHPRSGTTLLEQVLGSHPEIGAVDEPFVTQIARTAVTKQSFGSPAPRFNLARQRYIDVLRHRLGPGADGKLLLEKNPSPTASLPVALRLFPELKVLIALRDPRDVVVSCYFQNVPLNNVSSNFLTFERLARHYTTLMDIWLAVRDWVGLSWLESRYEDIVRDLDNEGRRVTAFLGLEWHEDQARFFASERNTQVQSPTYRDIAQPIYSRSVGRWRNYRKYLEPILPILEPYCRKFGYS